VHLWPPHFEKGSATHAHSAQEPDSLSWCYAVMSLQFTHVRCFACLQRQSCETCVQIVLLLAFIT